VYKKFEYFYTESGLRLQTETDVQTFLLMFSFVKKPAI